MKNYSPLRQSLSILCIGAILCSVGGCQKKSRYSGGYGRRAGAQITFKDQVDTNANPPKSIAELKFVDTNNNEIRLTDYRGEQNVVLVFMRGFSGALCPFCTAHSSRLITNYDEFQKRGAEVLLVYPGDTEHLDEFLTAARNDSNAQLDKVPFPVLLDENLEAVEFLQINANLANPSTYILDRDGQVRFAYVGEALNDRPSISAMLQQLDRLAEDPSSGRSDG